MAWGTGLSPALLGQREGRGLKPALGELGWPCRGTQGLWERTLAWDVQGKAGQGRACPSGKAAPCSSLHCCPEERVWPPEGVGEGSV